MKVFIKNMVCQRCINTVRKIFNDSGYPVTSIQLGEVELVQSISAEGKNIISRALHDEGFDLLDDKNSRLVEQIKNLIISEIHHEAGKKSELENFSEYIASQTRHDYSYLSKLFSAVEGITIEKYIISQKIERVKELLVYDELTLSEIAFRLGYSSSQHLSNQFRQITGMTPTAFKSGHHSRKHIDHI